MLAQTPTIIKISDIEVDNSFNCRGEAITPSDVYELMINIKKIGLLQPILVRPNDGKKKYFLIAGFRRLAACTFIKMTEIPAIIHTGLSDGEAEYFNLIENINRSQLNMLQEARGVQKPFLRGDSIQTIADNLQQSRDWVNVRIALLKLPEDIQKEAAAGILTQKAVKELVPIYQQDPERAYKMVAAIRDKKKKHELQTIEQNTKKQKAALTQKKVRPLGEIFQVQDVLLNALGHNLPSRTLAWAIGEISTFDLMMDIEKEMRILGLPFLIPQQYYESKYKKDFVDGDSDNADAA